MNRLINSAIFPDFFTGTTDDFLMHCLSKDPHDVQTEIEVEEIVCSLIKSGMDRETAMAFIHDMQTEFLEKNGFIKRIGSDADGEPLYEITEEGKKASNKEKRRKRNRWSQN